VSAYTDELRAKLRAKAIAGSRAAAIKLFCLECVGCERAAVRDCTDQACALWPWRPYQRREEG
jgi:hypothetical protein